MTNTTSRRDTADIDKTMSAEEIANHRKSPKSADSQQQLRQGFIGLEVVHVSHGRIRIQAQSKKHVHLLTRIAKLFATKDGFHGTSINNTAKSLVIKFDESQISTAVVLRILYKLGVADLRTSSPQKMPEDPFAAWKSGDFWQEQGLEMIPLLLGLAVTGRLGINGFAAIPVYLLTAEISRKVINYLQPQVSALLTTKPFKNQNIVNFQQKNTAQSETQSGNEGDSVHCNPSPNLSSVEHLAKLSTQQLLTRKQSESPRCSSDYSVVHAIPGRIRFYVPRIGVDREYTHNLGKRLQADSRVIQVRINPHASSVAIAYGNGSLDESDWANLLMLVPNPPIKSNDSISAKDSNIAPQSPDIDPRVKAENLSPPIDEAVDNTGKSPATEVNSDVKVHNPPVEKNTATISSHGDETGVKQTSSSGIAAMNITSSLDNPPPGWWNGMKSPALSYSLEFMANYPLA